MTVFENHTQWPVVKQVCKKLLDNGYMAYLAGGCVRDMILRRPPKDFDVATDAEPSTLQSLFDRTLDVGMKFGIVHVVIDGETIEVATFRKEGEYLDGRRPEWVEYSSPEDDSKRRDFTVNAMFFDMETNRVIDKHRGQEHLESRQLIAVGDPEKRFQEDHLRVLRGVRFASELGFSIEEKTWMGMRDQVQHLGRISVERIATEFLKTLNSEDPVLGLFLLRSMGAMEFVLPGWERLSIFAKINGLSALKNVALRTTDERVRWASLYIDRATEQLQTDLIHLKTSNAFRTEAVKIIGAVQSISSREMSVGEQVEMLLDPVLCFGTVLAEEINLDVLPEARKLAALWVSKGDVPPGPLVKGGDLMQIQKIPQQQYSVALKNCYHRQLENPGWSKNQVIKSFLDSWTS